jgi:hypothetical protein
MHEAMVIFEFKSGAKGEKAEGLSKQALDNRYGAELECQ